MVNAAESEKKVTNLTLRFKFFSVAGDVVATDRLALACIAQFRYLDVIYDSKRVFNAVFDCDLENWRCTPRDSLIQVLPEILPFPGVQQGHEKILKNKRNIGNGQRRRFYRNLGRVFMKARANCFDSYHNRESNYP